MQVHDLAYEDQRDLNDFLQQLVDAQRLEDPARGIVLLVIDQGIDALSDKQAHVFEKYVLNEFVVEKCAQCGNTIPWSEKFEAIYNGGICSWCQHGNEKLEEE